MSTNWNPIRPPAATLPLPDDLAKLSAEYAALVAKRTAAASRLGELRAPATLDTARRTDAQALGDAARAGHNIHAVGTPAQDKLVADTREAATVVDGLEAALETVTAELRAAIDRHADDGPGLALAECERVQRDYLAALDALETAATTYDATIHLAAGWQHYIATGRVAFGDRGSIIVRGQVLEPVNVATLTGKLREHANRHRLIADAINADRAERYGRQAA